jgi:branched-chain amino acid aminotransferase
MARTAKARELQIYIDGKFYPQPQAKVSVFDHGLLYGDGVFEGIRAYNGRVFKLERHVERLFMSAKAISLDIAHTEEQICEIILKTLRKNKIKDGYIRPVVTRGVGDIGIDPRKCKDGPTLVVIAMPFPALYGDKYEKGLKVVTSSYRRVPPQSLSPSIKSLNYLNNILARIEGNQRGADEVIMLDMQGYVSEATADNIFIVQNKTVVTPYTSTNLPGVTRETVFQLCRKLKIPVRERPFTMYDLWAANEVFVTGTAAEIGPVVEADGRIIGDGKPGPQTKRLMIAYRNLVTSTGTPI